MSEITLGIVGITAAIALGVVSIFGKWASNEVTKTYKSIIESNKSHQEWMRGQIDWLWGRVEFFMSLALSREDR